MEGRGKLHHLNIVVAYEYSCGRRNPSFSAYSNANLKYMVLNVTAKNKKKFPFLVLSRYSPFSPYGQIIYLNGNDLNASLAFLFK